MPIAVTAPLLRELWRSIGQTLRIASATLTRTYRARATAFCNRANRRPRSRSSPSMSRCFLVLPPDFSDSARRWNVKGSGTPPFAPTVNRWCSTPTCFRRETHCNDSAFRDAKSWCRTHRRLVLRARIVARAGRGGGSPCGGEHARTPSDSLTRAPDRPPLESSRVLTRARAHRARRTAENS